MSERLSKTMGLLVLSAVLACGCSGGNGTLKGVVTLDGQPVAEAHISLFSPTLTQKIPLYTAITDVNGKFEFPAAQKIPIGSYKVVITKYVAKEGMPAGIDAEQLRIAGKAKNSLPAMYETPGKSPIDVTVSAGKNDAPIELKSK